MPTCHDWGRSAEPPVKSVKLSVHSYSLDDKSTLASFVSLPLDTGLLLEPVTIVAQTPYPTQAGTRSSGLHWFTGLCRNYSMLKWHY